MARIDTNELLDLLADEGSWRLWDAPVSHPTANEEYARELSAARARSGRDESVTTGSARVGDLAVAVIAGDFRFLAGSVGQAASARVVSAFDRATSLGLPVLGLPSSGGTRMQEGTPAFLAMPAIAAAVARHREAGLPYLVYLRHPTTGGVLATWGSLGDVVHAQPGALVGFVGPRVYEGLYGRPFPDGIQTAEGLTEAGVVDGTADAADWRPLVIEMLTTWKARDRAATALAQWDLSGPDHLESGAGQVPFSLPRGQAPGSGWEAVLATRTPVRPGVRQLLEHSDASVPLSGTHHGETASATVLALARFGGYGCVLVGQDRSAQTQGKHVGPGDLRVARRGFALAERWGLPLLTVVDTQGGELSPAAEAGGLAGEIARCLADLATLRVPTLSLLLGGGSGGAALALVPADRVVAASDAWITPLPPEGASLIRYRTTDRAAEIADTQHITAGQLQASGAVDRIVASPCDGLGPITGVLAEELARLGDGSVDLGARAGRWMAVGTRVPD